MINTVGFKNLSSCLSLVVLMGCAARINHQGKLPDPDLVAQLKPGQQTQEDVLRLIGSPSSTAAFDKNTWIYDYRVTETKVFLEPEEKLHKITLIRFTPDGKVKEVQVQDGKGHNLVPVRQVTLTPGTDQTFLQSVFGNFGRKSKKEKGG